MSNEAAELLQHWDRMSYHERQVALQGIIAADFLDALAAERKATVETIRAMVLADSAFSPSLAEARVRLDSILAEVAK